jgi:hypothetical protein
MAIRKGIHRIQQSYLTLGRGGVQAKQIFHRISQAITPLTWVDIPLSI